MIGQSIKNHVKNALGRHYEPWIRNPYVFLRTFKRSQRHAFSMVFRNPYVFLRTFKRSVIAELGRFKQSETYLLEKPRELQLRLQVRPAKGGWNPFLFFWDRAATTRIRWLEFHYRYYYRRYHDALKGLLTDSSPRSTLLLVSGSLNSGGSERQTVLTTLGLARRGLRPVKLAVVYLRTEAERFYQHKLEAAGMPVLEFSRDTSRDDVPGVRELLQAATRSLPPILHDVADYARTFVMQRPAIVHLWLDEVNVKGGLAAVAAGVPRIILSGRSLSPNNYLLYQAYMREGYRWLLKQPGVTLINNSAAGARAYERWLGLRKGSIPVVYNGFDFDEELLERCRNQRTVYRERHGISQNAMLIGTVIRLSEEKRPLLWAEIAAQVRKALPEAHFLMVGDGPLRQELEVRAAQPDLSGRLHVVGVEKQAFDAMAAMDLFLLSSRGEGLPNVLVEAQALGVPVVTTNVGGAPEALDHERTGWVLGSDKPEQAAAEIVCLLKNQLRLHAAAEAGPEFVKNRFGLERMLDETIQLYK